MEQRQHPLAVAQDRVLVLDHRIGRQAPVLLRQVHRAARHRHADADLARSLDLEIDRLFETVRIEVVVVGRRRATRHQEFDQRDPHGRAQRIGGQPRPDRVERLQPGEEPLVDGGRVSTGQCLVEMVMRVDETGQDDMAAGVEHIAGGQRLGARGHQFGDDRSLDDKAAFRSLGKDRERILDPEARLCRRRAQ